MEDNPQDNGSAPGDDKVVEPDNYLELLEEEIWDEAIKSYNDILFSLLRYS